MANKCTCPNGLTLGEVLSFITNLRSGVDKTQLVLDGLCLVTTAVKQFSPATFMVPKSADPKNPEPTIEEWSNQLLALVPKGSDTRLDMDSDAMAFDPTIIAILLKILSLFFGDKIAEIIDFLFG